MSRSRSKPKSEKVYAYVGRVVTPLASGRPLAPGERATLTPSDVDDPHNRAMIDAGLLVHVPVVAADTEQEDAES